MKHITIYLKSKMSSNQEMLIKKKAYIYTIVYIV